MVEKGVSEVNRKICRWIGLLKVAEADFCTVADRGDAHRPKNCLKMDSICVLLSLVEKRQNARGRKHLHEVKDKEGGRRNWLP